MPGCLKAYWTTCGTTTLEFRKFSGCMKVAQCLTTPSLTFLPVSMVFFPQTIAYKSLEPIRKPLPSRDKPSTSQPTQIISVLHLIIRSIRNKVLEMKSFIYVCSRYNAVVMMEDRYSEGREFEPVPGSLLFVGMEILNLLHAACCSIALLSMLIRFMFLYVFGG